MVVVMVKGGWGGWRSCVAIIPKIRISDIEKKKKNKIKIRPTDPLQNLPCNPKHAYFFFWPNTHGASGGGYAPEEFKNVMCSKLRFLLQHLYTYVSVFWLE